MKQPIRMFSIGILTASIILLLASTFFSGDNKQAKDFSIDELIASIEKEGYHVISETEYIELAVKEDEANSQKEESATEDRTEENTDTETETDTEDTASDSGENTENNEDSQQVETNNSEVTYTLSIVPGMYLSSISNILVDQKIIDDANAFIQYLEDNGYSTRVQTGSFQLSNTMNLNEIAEALTN